MDIGTDRERFYKALMTPLGSRTEDMLKLYRKLQYFNEDEEEDGNMEEEEEMLSYQSIMPLETMLSF